MRCKVRHKRSLFYRIISYFVTPTIKEIIMSRLTDAMAVAIENLKASIDTKAGPTTEQITNQIHSIVDPQVAALQEALAAFEAADKTDDDAKEAAIADLTTAVGAFTTAFAPATPTPTVDNAA